MVRRSGVEKVENVLTFIHEIVGSGLPVAGHSITADLPMMTCIFLGRLVPEIEGATENSCANEL